MNLSELRAILVDPTDDEALAVIIAQCYSHELEVDDEADTDLGGPGSGNFKHRGRPGRIGGFAPSSAATIGEGEIVPGETSPQLDHGWSAGLRDDPAAYRAWLEANITIEGSARERALLLDTLVAAQIPDRYFAGLTKITTAAPENYEETNTGRFVKRGSFSGELAAGVYVYNTSTVHIAPTVVLSQGVLIHEMGHHVQNLKERTKVIGTTIVRLQDRLELRRNALPDNLETAGLRKYSLKNADELYADTFMVALKGSPAQQESLQRWIDMEWDALFVEWDLGGKGSGNYGHLGRPGKVGGSVSGVNWVKETGNRAALQIVSTADLRPNPNEEWTERYRAEVAPRLRKIVEAMLAGRPIPALTVAKHGAEFIVIDGRHRLEAAKMAGITEVGIQMARREWTPTNFGTRSIDFYNPYHDARGRFASKGATGGSAPSGVASPSTTISAETSETLRQWANAIGEKEFLYYEVNTALREGKNHAFTAEMDKALLTEGHAIQEVVYRGIHLDLDNSRHVQLLAAIQPGADFKDKGYFTTTQDPWFAEWFAKSSDSMAVVFALHPNGIKGLLNPHSKVKEVVLGRDLSWRITSVIRESNVIKVVGEYYDRT